MGHLYFSRFSLYFLYIFALCPTSNFYVISTIL